MGSRAIIQITQVFEGREQGIHGAAIWIHQGGDFANVSEVIGNLRSNRADWIDPPDQTNSETLVQIANAFERFHVEINAIANLSDPDWYNGIYTVDTNFNILRVETAAWSEDISEGVIGTVIGTNVFIPNSDIRSTWNSR